MPVDRWNRVGAKLVRLQKSRGAAQQGCDIYIGRKVENARWDLPKSVWANPHYCKGGKDDEESLRIYEEHVRKDDSLLRAICTLEGHTVGCWCRVDEGERCHGEVLIKILEEQQRERIRWQLEKAGLEPLRKSSLGEIRQARAWAEHKVWLANATAIDDTNLYMFVPEYYAQLKNQLDWAPEYWPVVSKEHKLFLVVGEYHGTQPCGPFWTPEDEIVRTPNALLRDDQEVVEFAVEFQKYLDKQHDNSRFVDALNRAMEYFALHRNIVREAGRALGVDMLSHDLTKTRIVHCALAYLCHWNIRDIRDENLCDLAKVAIRVGHCEKEDHHPEYETSGKGDVDTCKLFTDRISVHMQKEKPDKIGGWDINPAFIPDKYKTDFDAFRQGWGHLDLYKLAYIPALANTADPQPYDYAKRGALASATRSLDDAE